MSTEINRVAPTTSVQILSEQAFCSTYTAIIIFIHFSLCFEMPVCFVSV